MQSSSVDEFEFSGSPPTSINKRTRSPVSTSINEYQRVSTSIDEYRRVSTSIDTISTQYLHNISEYLSSSATNNNEYLFCNLYLVLTTHVYDCKFIYLFIPNIFDELRRQYFALVISHYLSSTPNPPQNQDEIWCHNKCIELN